MASNSRDDDIGTIQMVSEYQLGRDEAARLLQTSNNNLEEALNKWFDKGHKALEPVPDTRWDGSAFGHEAFEGLHEPDTSGNPSFNIEYPTGVDNYPRSGLQSGAPSRPPSRISQRSGASSMQIDGPIQSIENQESGFIGNQRPAFGPATRDAYDTNNWAMVPVTTSAEFIPDAEPSARKREEGGPAVIKPMPNQSYLPALITILHSIPQFRNALLSTEVSQTKYWVGDDWWKGIASAPRTFDSSSSIEVVQQLDIIYETQRLMAFLDTSERAYTSLGCLLQLDAWKQSTPAMDDSDDDALKFLLTWSSAYQSHSSHAKLDGVLRSSVNANGTNQACFILDVSVIQNDPTIQLNLYDVLDEAILSHGAHIVDVSNVLILRLTAAKPDATGLNCKIPATFYADRYMEENKETINAMISEKKQYQDQLTEIDAKARKLKYHIPTKGANSEPLDALKLLKTSMKAFEPKEDDLIENPKNSEILLQLQSVYESIERKLRALDEQKDNIRKTLDSISSRFRAPIDNPETSVDVADGEGTTKIEDVNGMDNSTGLVNGALDGAANLKTAATPSQPSLHPLKHPYKLCGVSTRPDVFYILHPDKMSNTRKWWRVEYSTATSEAYILREQLSLSQVVERASSENATALLIYANEAATAESAIPLADPLTHFVKQDNVMFMEEQQTSMAGFDDVSAGDKAYGGWDKRDPEDTWDLDAFNDQDAFATMSAKEYHEQNANSEQSSTTLTPSTDVDDLDMTNGTTIEMTEVNDGYATWAGGVSNASSDTVGGETMDVVIPSSQHGVSLRDADMSDVDLADDEPDVQHIEKVMERKGG